MYTYLVEIIYNRVKAVGPDEAATEMEMTTDVFSFQDKNKGTAKQNAAEFFDKVRRYGIEKSGGAVLKSLIPPHCIVNIGLVDLEQFQADRKAKMEAEESEESVAALVTPDVEAPAESALVSDVVGVD